MCTWSPTLTFQDPCTPGNSKAPQGRHEWNQEADTNHISRITWKMALWVKSNTGRSWTCGCVDSFSAVKPMSQLWIILQWLHVWLLVIAFLLENTSWGVCIICSIRLSPVCPSHQFFHPGCFCPLDRTMPSICFRSVFPWEAALDSIWIHGWPEINFSHQSD
jgi:hypothetical protein